ncbi:choice-of-anchor L domain-containing protein [Flavobacterium ardleyense]|uniref:Choice-of-anchor L domain-containing protein n=1 Tax=Flavobacterium ardleyense TaxID=2038737 RepID=A0ABW5Z6A1_9FLAO
MKKITYIFLFLSTLSLFSQTITVDDTSNSAAQLVDLLLGNSCVEVSNISMSSSESVAYFNKNASAFPINEGVIIRNGRAINTQGVYNGVNLSTQINTNSDSYLQNLSIASGQTGAITDVAFLEFDFIPLSNTFSFDFLFASNEYGEYQCGFSDVFAFVLTDLNSGIETNLAVIPGTNIPVTVKDIRNSLYNFPDENCTSSYARFFDVYNVDNPASSTLNMRGHTVVMNAASVVIPNTPYKIRLVIGDYNDSGYDSAVFLAAGSFTTALDLGPDQIICTGDEFELNSNLDNSFAFTWFENGIAIPGATNASYVVLNSGTYKVEATKGSCVITDTVIFTDLFVNAPQDLLTCDTGDAFYNFDLSRNNEIALGVDNAIYSVFYYEGATDIAANNPIPNENITSYSSAGGQTIYLKLFNTISDNFCDAVYSFNLIVSDVVTASQPVAINLCETAGTTNYTFLNQLITEVLNGQAPTAYTVTFYSSIEEATLNSGAISSIAIPNGISSVVVGIRMQDNANANCFDVTSVTFVINPMPLVDTIPNQIECHEYTLPVLVNGNYFGGPNGTGIPYFAGDIIDMGGTYFVYVGPDVNGCTNETSFNLYFIDEYVAVLDHCGLFTVPRPPYDIGAFYTAPGGPSGSGSLLQTGTQFPNTTASTITTTIYYYAEVDGILCRDDAFLIHIHPLPLVDSPATVVTCDSYVLPALLNGNYFSGANGSGTPLFAGDVVSVDGPNFPGTYYVYNEAPHINSVGSAGNCSLENSFQINLVNTTQFVSVFGCGNFNLPAVAFGGYFTEPMGAGTQITDLNITTSQTVYYYTNTTILPNCTDNLNYIITINPRPQVDELPTGSYCGEFILPALTNGTYYKLSGGPSVIGQQQLNAGNRIDLSNSNVAPGTYYIYSGPDSNNCDNESSFTISINPFPPTDGVLDRFECSPYSIATPINGIVYTEIGGPAGTGVVVSSSDVFNDTKTFYLYNIDNVTGCEINKPFTIKYNGINLPDYQSIAVCETENYQLPTLTHSAPTPLNYTIGYFYDAGGINPVPNGIVFNTPNTSTTIYVRAVNGDRIICKQEDSFEVEVLALPNLASLNLVFGTESCGNYILPALPITPYAINYYTQPGGNVSDLISDLTVSTPGTYTYYLNAKAGDNLFCADEISFIFTVYPLLDITLQDGIICVDAVTGTVYRTATIQTGLDPTLFTVNWYLNGTLMGSGSSYTADQAGIYDVEFIKLTPDVGANCNYNNTTVAVLKAGPAIADFTVSDAFENNPQITVNIAGGFGDYQYQLVYPDGNLSSLQSSDVFSNLATGEYFVNIYDILGDCSPERLGPIYIINYPKYFTPNGDGINDYWNVWDLDQQSEAVISIFDRYGKFIKQLSPSGAGWDGTHNGQKLLSTDYWFTVEYLSQNSQSRQLFKAHFSLKR